MRGLLRNYRVFKLWIVVISYTIAVGIPSPNDLANMNLITNTTLNTTSIGLFPSDGNENLTAAPVTNFTEDMESFSDNISPNFYLNISVSGTSQTCISYGLPNDQYCLEVSEFNNVTLWCNVSDRQEQTVMWFIEDIEHSDKYIGISGSALRIYNISRSCGFKYKCKVKFTDNTTVTYSIKVIATYPPYIFLKSIQQSDIPLTTPYYDAVSITTGTYVEIVCIIDAVPKPYYVEWKVNDETYYKFENNTDNKLKVTNEHYYEFSHEDSGLLFKVKVKVVEDDQFGNYTCLANNSLGYDEWNFIVIKTTKSDVIDEGEESGNGSNDDDDY